MTKAVVTLEFPLKPEAVEPFTAQLADILAETATKDGFISVAVHRVVDGGNTLLLLEEWESAAHYQAYLQWRVDTGLMDVLQPILAGDPKITIWDAPTMRFDR